MKKALSEENASIRFAEDAWLNYFNRYLLIKGVISEKEYKRMTEIIATRKTGLSQRKNTT